MPFRPFSGRLLTHVSKQDTQRKFDTLIFLHGTSEMRLPPETAGFRGEFHFFASQVVKNLEENDKEQLDQLIFAEMTYTNKTQAIIIGFGVQSLPSAYFLKRDIRLDSEKGTLTPMRAQDRFEVPFSFDAEDYAKVLKMQHDIDVGDIVMPTFFDNWYAFPLILVVGVAGVTIGWRVYNSEFIKSPLLWASASFSVFAIASSGFFFTLIKKTSWAVHGASIAATKTMQTKYESVIVPFLYLFITMSVLVCVGVVPRIRSVGVNSHVTDPGTTFVVVVGVGVETARSNSPRAVRSD